MRLSSQQIATLARQAVREHSSVPQAIVEAVIMQESGGDPSKRGKAGEYGLMQLMPGTADMLGFRGDYNLLLTSPLLNVKLGTKYLAQQFKRYGNWAQALSAYNAGTATSRNVLSYVRPVLARAGMSGAVGGGLGVLALVGAAFLAFRRRR